MTTKRIVTSTLALTGAVLLAMSLTGCSNPIDNAINSATDKIAEQGAEKIIEGAGGGDLDVEFQSLPEGFPAEVPLVSTDIIQGLKIKDDDGVIYSVTVSDTRDVASVAPDVEGAFAGWEEVFSQEAMGMKMYQYSNDHLHVIVSVSEGDAAGIEGGSIVQYNVSEADE